MGFNNWLTEINYDFVACGKKSVLKTFLSNLPTISFKTKSINEKWRINLTEPSICICGIYFSQSLSFLSSLPGTNKPECSHCLDNPRRKCKHCACSVCGGKHAPERQIICDECNQAYHLECIVPPLTAIPEEDEWYTHTSHLSQFNLFIY